MGRALLERLITESEADGYWTLQAQMFTENHASRELHRKCGFREVGIRERYGHIDGIWHDVILLERRSSQTGGPGLPTKTCDG
jgi:phosphinothricin acetyltransferase